MWCLETLKALNGELAKGKTQREAEKAVGIYVPPLKNESFKVKDGSFRELCTEKAK